MLKLFKSLAFGIGHKLALLFGLLIFGAAFSMALLNIGTTQQDAAAKLEAEVRQIAELIIALVEPEIEAGDDRAASNILARLRLQMGVRRIAIADIDGKIIASSLDEKFESSREVWWITRLASMPAAPDGYWYYRKNASTVRARLLHDANQGRFGAVVLSVSAAAAIDMQNTWRRNIWLSLLLALMSGWYVFHLIRRLISPVEQILHATEKVAGGDLSGRLDVKSNEGLERFATGFNSMLEELQAKIGNIEKLAFSDRLTELPNRAPLMERMSVGISMANQRGDRGALLLLGLDRFKRVNDALGHSSGDLLLKVFAERLNQVVHLEDGVLAHCMGETTAMIARLGGDEFTVLLDRIDDRDCATKIAQRIIQLVEQPVEIDGRDIAMSTSIGIAIFPDDGKHPESVLKAADTAMREAKKAGRNRYKFFDHILADEIDQRLRTENALRVAINDNSLTLAIQPQLDTSNLEIVGAEALARWHDREFGFVPPSRFLSVAEESGMISALGGRVMEEAFGWAMRPQILARNLHVSVNVSASDLEDPIMADRTLEMIGRHNLDPARLEIEVTESLAMSENPAVTANIQRLRLTGVRFAVDDFGVGYSNLAKLKTSHFQTLKLDRSLIADLEEDDDDKALLSLIATMAQMFQMCIVAEGIETSGQLALIREAGCQIAQGFHIGKPMMVAEFSTWLAQYEAENSRKLLTTMDRGSVARVIENDDC